MKWVLEEMMGKVHNSVKKGVIPGGVVPNLAYHLSPLLFGIPILHIKKLGIGKGGCFDDKEVCSVKVTYCK